MAGQGGTGTTADMGIQYMDSSTGVLTRPLIKNCRILGNGASNYL